MGVQEDTNRSSGTASQGPLRGRFVILRHERPADTHWDLMLEVEGLTGLPTWQIAVPPENWIPQGAFDALRLPDHRQAYLTYQGPISGGRGTVTRVEEGAYTNGAVGHDAMTCMLHGTRWTVRMTATRQGERWAMVVAASPD